MAPSFIPRRRVVAIDLRGHDGESGNDVPIEAIEHRREATPPTENGPGRSSSVIGCEPIASVPDDPQQRIARCHAEGVFWGVRRQPALDLSRVRRASAR